MANVGNIVELGTWEVVRSASHMVCFHTAGLLAITFRTSHVRANHGGAHAIRGGPKCGIPAGMCNPKFTRAGSQVRAPNEF